MTHRWIAVTAVLAGFACNDHHDHEHHEQHGHGHGALDMTLWGESTELFAEYSPLVVGKPSEFAAHLTTLRDFKPVLAGLVTVELVQSDGSKVAVRSRAPARPGIYTPSLTPTVAGSCTLTITLKSGTTSERHTAPSCQVHTEAPAEREGDESGISFLKEQQWKTDFATAVVGKRTMRRTVRVYARVKPASGRHAHLTAALAGRVRFPKTAPVIGARVERGQLLGLIAPPMRGATNRATLRADIAAARAEADAAGSDLDRVNGLAKEDAIAQRRLKEARSRAAVARSKLRAARARLREYDATAWGRGGGNLFRVRSPLRGTIVEVEVTEGQTVNGGAEMFTIIDVDTVWIEGRVFEPDIAKVVGARGARLHIEGRDEPFLIGGDNGRLVTLGHMVDPRTRTVPIIFEMTNPKRVLRIGQMATLDILTGDPVQALAIPESAIITDRGRSVVFVHSSGETFEQRMISTGIRARGWVAIESGLEPGERVVTRGAYTVKLAASAASAPGHGHAH
jgi:RND family efflux transporter MFP subunit